VIALPMPCPPPVTTATSRCLGSRCMAHLRIKDAATERRGVRLLSALGKACLNPGTPGSAVFSSAFALGRTGPGVRKLRRSDLAELGCGVQTSLRRTCAQTLKRNSTTSPSAMT
jgi:hypothetical protein